MALAILLAGAGALLPGAAPATSLRFHGNGTGGIDRVKIPIDGPATAADIGSTSFTLEWWMRARPGENASEAVGCGASDGWITGNIIFDRDVFGAGDDGDFGVSLTGGRIAFGVSAGPAGNTICGATLVTDGEWHHVAVTRRKSTGELRIYVNGVLDAVGTGGVGADRDVAYRDGRVTAYQDSDPFLVIGAEKHDAGPQYPSFRGWIDEVRLSTELRYTASRFTRPFSAFAAGVPNTAAIYHLDEGAGDSIGDATGGSPGTREFGGSPAGPEWVSEGAPLDITRRVGLEPVVQGVRAPVAIAHAGDDRLFVVEKAGRILAYRVTESPPFTFLGEYLDIAARVNAEGERGLLGLAFHPDFAENRYFFVYYTRAGGGGAAGDIVIARYRAATADATSVDPDTERVLLTIEHSENSNHNGGGIAFGPDGHLYAPIGDGGGAGDPHRAGQSLTTHLGKILRLAVDVSEAGGSAPFYTIPTDNPFAASAGSEKKEIWAWGLRNPWRTSFDRVTGDFFIGDVGQNAREEIDFQLAGSPGGANYGWSRMEGTACYPPGAGCAATGLTPPILEYPHGEGCAVAGGYRYRGHGIPTLHGVYVFGDYCRGTIWGGVQAGDGAWSRAPLLSSGLTISTFGEDAAGELYVADLEDGAVHRIVQARPRLTVTKSGNGSGTVSAADGLACGAVCSVEYDPGQIVDLTAVPAASSWLAGWSGACDGVGSCTVLMDGDRVVTATFAIRPVFQFSAPSYTVKEGAGSATISVRRLGTTAGTATVDYAIEPGSATAPPAAAPDFGPPPGSGGLLTGTLTFMPGQSTRTFAVPIVADMLVEGPETVLLSLHAPTGGGILGAQPTAVLTIADRAGTVQFAKAAVTTPEFARSVRLTLTRTGPAGSAASVPYHLAGKTTAVDTAVTPLDGTVSFGPGRSSAALDIHLLDDATESGNAALTATLGAAPANGLGLGAPSVATVTLVDDDGTVAFAQPVFTVDEAARSATIRLTRTGGTTRPVTVRFATGGDADTATPSATPGACSPGADYRRIVDGSLTFNRGETSRTFAVRLCGDGLVESPEPETLTLRLLAVSAPATIGSQSTAILRIQDNDGGGTIRFSSAAYSVTEGSGPATVTVLRTGGAAGTVVVPWSLGGTAIPSVDHGGPTSGELAFGPNQTSASLSIPVMNDTLVDGRKDLLITLGAPTGGAALGSPAVATLGIHDDEPSVRFSSGTYAVAESSAGASVTVIRGGSTGGVVTVSVRTTAAGTAQGSAGACGAGSDFTTATLPVTFNAGETSKKITIPLCPDTAAEGPETIGLALDEVVGATLGTPSTATIQIADDDVAGSVQFGADASSASEAEGTASIRVTRSGGAASGVTVHWTITGGSAVHGEAPGTGVDYTGPLEGVLAFGPSQGSQSIPVSISRRTGAQGPRSVTLVLDGADGGGALGARTVTTLWIVDADDPAVD